MAIAASDIVFRLSVSTGAAGDSTGSTPAASLGKYVATTVMAAGLNGLYDDVSGDENAASVVDYRCFFVLNNHPTLTLSNAVIYLSAEVAGGTSIAIAIDNIGHVPKGQAGAQSAVIANELAAPTGVGAFSSPTVKSSGLSLGSLAAGEVCAVWVRRTAANSAALNADGVTFAVAGDTSA